MNEMIWTGSVKQDKYVDLIKQRDLLRKEAFQINREYIRVFGEKILAVFEKKIECIRKKKMIAYCQAAINRGEAIDQVALQAYLALQMKEYQKQLKDKLAEHIDELSAKIDDFIENTYARDVFDHYVNKHPALIRIATGEEVSWEEAFGEEFSSISKSLRHSLVGLMEKSGRYKLK